MELGEILFPSMTSSSYWTLFLLVFLTHSGNSGATNPFYLKFIFEMGIQPLKAYSVFIGGIGAIKMSL